jgi:hypothetical protein
MMMSNLTVFTTGVSHMNNKRRILPLLFSLFLLLGAAPAWAVSFNSIYSISRLNTAGAAYVNMTRSNNTFCYLSMVAFEETDTGGEWAMCRLIRGSVVWTLEARLGTSSDADAHCSAICYNN